MKSQQLFSEMLYHASLSPFKKLVENGDLSNEDYFIIDTILRAKYSPIFVEKRINLRLDIKDNQR